MSLLFNENLSPTLPKRLSDVFPSSFHLQHFNYSNMPDVEVWRLAKELQLCIVSCDSDFYSLAFTRGAPPKVIWLQMGAARTDDVEACRRMNREAIESFLARADEAVLVLTD